MKIRTIAIPAASAALALTFGLAAGGGGGYFAAHTAAQERLEQCQSALDESERVLGITAQGLGLAGEAIVAAASWDYVELERLNTEMEALADDIGDPTAYHAARDACHGDA